MANEIESQTKADQFSHISDGPYIEVKDNELHLQWICNGQVFNRLYQTARLPLEFKQCGLSAQVSSLLPAKQQTNYSGNFKVAALSDIHGQFDLMFRILSKNNIIDSSGNWIFNNGHLVITGDIFDRGEQVTETLWFIYQLEKLARQQGGKVHLLLGNHEVMILNRDLRYLHQKYLTVETLLATSYTDLFSKNSILGNWLRSKYPVVSINKIVYLHGGLHPDLTNTDNSLKSINKSFSHSLVEAEMLSPRTAFQGYLHGVDGPVWYRGYFDKSGANREQINKLLSHFSINHIVVGHTSHKMILPFYNQKVFGIDSSIKKGQYGELLLVENGQFYRGTVNGRKLPMNKLPINKPTKL